MLTNYSECTLEELQDIKRNINPELVPERYQELLMELEKRAHEIEAQKKHYAQQAVVRVKICKNICAWLQLISGVFVFVSLLYHDIENIRFFTMGLFISLLSFFAGYYLLKNTKLGYTLSYINQTLQLVYISVGTFAFTYLPMIGVYLSISDGLTFSAHMLMSFTFDLMFEAGVENIIGINLLALGFIFMLDRRFSISPAHQKNDM